MALPLRTCFCCCELKTGTVSIAVYYIVGGVASVLTSIITTEALDPDPEVESFRDAIKTIKTVSIVVAAMGSLLTLMSGLLIHSLMKNKPMFLLPWMVYVALYMIVFVASNVIDTVVYSRTQDYLLAIYSVLWAVTSSAFETYSILLVYSLYRELKREEEQKHPI
ncbi:uncharacterized protein [Periplaneta americana]|uniref:uncharacterized protein isoform X2 n=1 Tax=Periplaneta americana TaxID=6978 RepID=UPI0037E85FE4